MFSLCRLSQLSLQRQRTFAVLSRQLATPRPFVLVAPLKQVRSLHSAPFVKSSATSASTSSPSPPTPTTSELNEIDALTKEAGKAFFEDKDYAKTVAMFKTMLTRKDFTNENLGVVRMVAVMFANGGKECEQDVSKAKELFEALASQKDAFGLFGLGLLHLKGRGVAQDFLSAARYFREAAAEKNTAANYYLGVLHELGIGIAKDSSKALAFYETAAAHGDANALTNLGMIYRKRCKFALAHKYFLRAARENELAFFTLSAMTDRGEHVEGYKPNHGYLDLMWITGASPDVHLQAILVENGGPLDFSLDLFDFAKADGPVKDKHAFQFVTLLYNAGEGSLFARFLAGMRYEFGLVESFGHGMLMDTYRAQVKDGAEFVEPSHNRIALDMFISAADQEFVIAQRKLGLVYATGKLGVSQDAAKAAKVFEELAAKNDPIAQYNLGVLYLTGRGVEKDAAKAAEMFQSASRQGLSDAEYNLGLMYEAGDGVKKDAARAKQLFVNASKRALVDATEKLKEL
ncbi:UNVERIFIED_CONTAM: hypothetical protein HDU68_002525 [Siphonaria sp. JEL0065]|nr:hypothetical protein HDU68_002525 [Siphonaria sp. JEL0065]